LTKLKAKQSSFIFGGFTTVDLKSCPWSGKYKSDRKAFIFSLINQDNKPLKLKIKSNQHQHAILCNSEFGPAFGYDFVVVTLIWVELINILNLQKEQMKQKRF
jgi:hypothetical protein